MSRLDEFLPVWQFNEIHSRQIAATPERVYDAIKNVRADEISFFRALTWIRRCGRRMPQGILNPGSNEPILDVATRTGFICLADEPREIVVGTAVIAPKGTALTPELFRNAQPPGLALAAMNFRIDPQANGTRVTTETRIYANDTSSRRRFALYWRIIYPGSALIRRMWLRAIERRAVGQ